VFPAYAGVFLIFLALWVLFTCVPRIRGGVPKLYPRNNAVDSYILIGAARSRDGSFYLVSTIVNRYTNEVESIDVVQSANIKKEPGAVRPELREKTSLQSLTGSAISIANLLDRVKEYFPDILPATVLEHYGMSRPDTKIGRNIRYSLKDSEGRTLTPEQAEFFKDSKVRDENGNLLVVYNGTPYGGFTEFELPKYFYTLTSAQGAGYYFTDKRNAMRYTKPFNGKTLVKSQLYKVYLNIKNPLEITKYSKGKITDDLFREMAERGNYKWGKEHTDIEEILKYNKTDADRLSELVRFFNGDYILEVMRDVLGHDGVKWRNKYGEMREIWVAWDKSQIKSVDNLRPTDDPDIRFSLKSPVEEETGTP